MQDFPHYLRDLGRSADPQLGFFGPSSLVWTVSRERVLLLAGMRALLLQVANPKVAQGVADHSDFQRWPVRRMTRTFAAVYAIAFGTREEAIEAALNVHRIHQRVRGTVKDPLPRAVDPRYDANDPELLLWVFATLADSTVSAYGTFFHPLSSQECERYYQDYRMFGSLFGIPDHFFPDTWEGLQSWFREELSESRLVITPTARRIFRELLSCTVTARLAAPINYILAGGMLPPQVRAAFGIRWSRSKQAAYLAAVAAVRASARVAPDLIRVVSAARRKER
jgi:uncharacterized protein (DUF2236 family)